MDGFESGDEERGRKGRKKINNPEMMINDYLVYIILAFTVTAIPGPAVVLTIKNSIRLGYGFAIVNVVGNFFAMIILASLSAIGLGAILLASTTLFSLMKIAGCLYLIYLGVKAWRAPLQFEREMKDTRSDKKMVAMSVFKEGFGVGITNPKAIAFFTALFPQFIDPTRSFFPQFLTLILTIEGISFIVLSSYAVMASLAAPYLAQERTTSFFNRVTGVAFIGFGLALWGDE